MLRHVSGTCFAKGNVIVQGVKTKHGGQGHTCKYTARNVHNYGYGDCIQVCIKYTYGILTVVKHQDQFYSVCTQNVATRVSQSFCLFFSTKIT